MAALFGRFSRSSRTVLEGAHKIALQLGRPVQTDTVLLSIFESGITPATEVLKTLGLEQKQLIDHILSSPPAGNMHDQGITPEMSALLEEAIKLGQDNSKVLKLSKSKIDEALSTIEIQGHRYPEQAQKMINR